MGPDLRPCRDALFSQPGMPYLASVGATGGEQLKITKPDGDSLRRHVSGGTTLAGPRFPPNRAYGPALRIGALQLWTGHYGAQSALSCRSGLGPGPIGPFQKTLGPRAMDPWGLRGAEVLIVLRAWP